MTGYGVHIDSDCTGESALEQYGEWWESCDNTFKSIYRTDERPDISSILDLEVGDPCFVVWVEWSTGDSFGTGTRNQTGALAVFVDIKAAQDFAESIRAQNENYEKNGVWQYQFKVNALDGQVIDVYASWNGYFETLESVNIENTFIAVSSKHLPMRY